MELNNSPQPRHTPAPQPENKPAPVKHKRNITLPGISIGKRSLYIIIALLSILAIVSAAGYFDTKNQLDEIKNPPMVGKNETEKIVNQVSKYVQLPQGETPTLADVKDISKLKSQAFFKHAQNGDKVLVYTQDGSAVIYRPSTKKVIIYSFISTNQ